MLVEKLTSVVFAVEILERNHKLSLHLNKRSNFIVHKERRV